MEDMQKRIDRADTQQEKKDAIKVRFHSLLPGHRMPPTNFAPHWKHYLMSEQLIIPNSAGNV